MWVSSFILGILGGLAGIGVHAVLLVRFFMQTHGLFQVFLQLALAVALGLAALVVAAVCRRSLRTLAVFLPILGVLGFFPRPVSWAPAGALLVAGGVTALISLRREPQEEATGPGYTTVGPDGRPLHWSEAAKLGLPAASAKTTGRRDRSWGPGRRAGAGAVALVAAAAVVTLSLWSPWNPATPRTQAVQEALETATSLVAVSPSTTATTIKPTTTTTAPPTTSTTISPGSDIFNNFSDSMWGISIDYPRDWRNTDPSNVGDRVFWDEGRIMRDEWQDAYVAAAFADWQGPTLDGCYLDYIWVEVHDDVAVDASMIPEFQTWLEDWVVDLGQYYPDVRVLEPVKGVVVSGLPGLVHTWTVFLNGYTLITRECVLIADDCYYFLEFTAVRDDWDDCEPLFRRILENFRAIGASHII